MIDLDPLGMLAELTRPHRHREHYTAEIGGTRWSRDHTTRVPSLLRQLEAASPSGEGAARGGGFESRPAARVEALDTLHWIDQEASMWVKRLGEDDPGFTDRCLTLLGGLLPSAGACGPRGKRPGCCHLHDIEHDIRRWWTQARIVTGWDTPPWRPDVTCPNCERRGGLRIRLEERVGMCTECHESWDPSGYQQLAEHVREQSMAKLGRRTEPCWCPWPTPVDRIGELCPKCRSARCHRAVQANFEKVEREAAA